MPTGRVGARSPQGAQQEGLGLVVAMVGEGEDFVIGERLRECPMARIARGAFQAEAGCAVDVDMGNRQRHAQRIANALAVRGPSVGVGMQAVVHVDGAQAGAARVVVARKHVQQDSGIQAAAEADQAGAGTRWRDQARDSRLARSIHSRWSRL